MRMNKGTLFVFSAPSGTGKYTVLKELLGSMNNIKYSISATTREPREFEEKGVHYHFLSKEIFEETLNNNGFLEYTEYIGNYYGTPKKPVSLWLEQGFDVILEIEVKGAKKIKEICPDAIFIFMLPPSKEELLVRLKCASTGLRNDIESRYQTSLEEMKAAYLYDYTVVNDDLNETIFAVKSIINANRYKTDKMKKIIDEVVQNA